MSNPPATSTTISNPRRPSDNAKSPLNPLVSGSVTSPDSREAGDTHPKALINVSPAPAPAVSQIEHPGIAPAPAAPAALPTDSSARNSSGPQSWAEALQSLAGTTPDAVTSLRQGQTSVNRTGVVMPRHYIIPSGEVIGLIREDSFNFPDM